MKNILLGVSAMQVPSIAVGCFRIHSMMKKDVEVFFKTAIEHGANFFDHADVYGGGTCESMFADALRMNGDTREKVIIQTKCGIHDNQFDFSKEHILHAVDGSLKRLDTDYIDVLLLHRPDALVEPEEVAAAFDLLHSSGKVRHFGVSNHKPMQIELLKKYLNQPIVANQLQLSITNANMIAQGVNANMLIDESIDRDESVLDYCRINDITIQPWSPFQYGFFEGVFLDNDKFPELNRVINEIADKHHVTNTTIAIAWLLRHPAHMQPITGTTNISRLLDCLKAAEVTLSRADWYAIYLAAGYRLP